MASTEDVKKMQSEGKSEQEITKNLRQKGFSDRDSDNLISQAKIKDAVNASSDDFGQNTGDGGEPDIPVPGGNYYETRAPDSYSGQRNMAEIPSVVYEGMEPSMLAQQQEQEPQGDFAQDYSGYPSQVYPQQDFQQQQYPQYQPYQESLSSDLVTEISEQVVNEKLSNIKDKLEAAIDFRTIAETRINGLNDRMMRVEKIIDALQISLLQKVGDYVNSVVDIKKEMEETQKSFKALHSKHSGYHAGSSGNSHNSHGHHSHSEKKHRP